MTKQINLNRTFHPESLWPGLADPIHDEYAGLSYDEARHHWRVSQAPSVIESLAAEYKKLRNQGTPHRDIDEACYDGYLEYLRRWPGKGRKLLAEIRQGEQPDAVSERLNQVQPNDEVIKGNEAIKRIPDRLPDRLDDSIIAANLIGDVLQDMK